MRDELNRMIASTDKIDCLVDERWIGFDGIGRYATETFNRLGTYRTVEASIKRLGLFEPLSLSFELIKKKPSVYYTPGFNPPLISSIPVVFTIHDLIHVRYPAESSLAKRIYYNFHLKRAARNAAYVITVSEFSRREIVSWAKIDKRKVIAIYNGVSSQFIPVGNAKRFDRPYLFYVGNRKPHKNVPTTWKALTLLKETHPKVQLLMTGIGTDDELRRISNMGLENVVKFIGFVDDATLAEYYRGAIALVLPSFYEGFGLPAIEAMACGTAVIVANATALPEICTDAGIYFNPCSSSDLVDKMRQVLDSPELRKTKITLGLQVVKKYDWDDTAQRIEDVLCRAAKEGASI